MDHYPGCRDQRVPKPIAYSTIRSIRRGAGYGWLIYNRCDPDSFGELLGVPVAI